MLHSCMFNILILENYCKSIDLKPQRAFNGKDAIEKIKKIYAEGQKIRLVLIDVNMPIMDGYQTTITLREMIKNKEIDDLVILGITAYVAKEKIDK
ncbi:MAG: response regulator, partial [Moraxellaceae bacterium]